MPIPLPGWRRDLSAAPHTDVDLRAGWQIYRDCEYRESDPGLLRVHGLDSAWTHKGSPVTPTHWRLSKSPAARTAALQGARGIR